MARHCCDQGLVANRRSIASRDRRAPVFWARTRTKKKTRRRTTPTAAIGEELEVAETPGE